MDIFGSCGQKGAALLLVALFCAPVLAAAPASAAQAERCAPDSLLGAPFVACGTEAEGGFRATLVRLPFRGGDSAAAPKANVLFVHGFNDYFFQRELAGRLDSAGYAFWAVDLHKYGRSWREGERRGEIDSVGEYFPELDSAVAAMREANGAPVVLLGHSTGGLVVSCYAAARGRGRGLAALALDSPFLEMNYGFFVREIGVPAVSALASLFPRARLPRSGNENYARSLHRSFGGEWDYDLRLKEPKSIVVDFAWVRAIHRAQLRMQAGPDLLPPVLVMHSGCSVSSRSWDDDYRRCDGVLDRDHIRRFGANLGGNVRMVEIEGGLHDLFLSPKPARERAYEELLRFLDDVAEGRANGPESPKTPDSGEF